MDFAGAAAEWSVNALLGLAQCVDASLHADAFEVNVMPADADHVRLEDAPFLAE